MSADEELVLLAQKGDRPAFEELVRRTSRLVFARIYMETGDPHRAEDLVQETFLTAFRSLQQVKDPRGFRSWLFTVAQTVAIDSFRRDSRKKRSGLRADPSRLESLGDKGPEPDEAAEQREAREQVLSILRSMPEEYRLPLMLRYLAGADYDTISRQLGLSNGSLRGLLNRGMAMLRSEIQKSTPGGTIR
jgi:RNA polymerase sigma-70 factor (ECF subfamily)